MSAEILRRAAEQARAEAEIHRSIVPHLVELYGDDCGSELRALRDLAVADWLEAKAEQDDKGTCDADQGVCNLCEHDYVHIAALTVARAYLGEQA